AKNHLMEARQLVEQALGAARAAADDAGAREARRMVETGIREQGEQLERTEKTERAERTEEITVGDRVRLAGGGAGEVLEVRLDGQLVVVMGAMKMVVDAADATRTASTRNSVPSP